MFFKKFINLLALLIFGATIVYVIFKINNSVSSLNKIAFAKYENIPEEIKKDNLKIHTPLIIDGDNVYFNITFQKADSNFNVLAALNTLNLEVVSLHIFDSAPISIVGFNKNEELRLFLVEKNKILSFLLFDKNNLLLNKIDTIPFKKDEIESFAIVRNSLEVISVDHTTDNFILSSYSNINNTWQKSEIRSNPFFHRISKPLTAYFLNSWHFIAKSNFYLKSDLFSQVQARQSNLMTFRNDYSNHLADVIIPKTKDSITFSIDRSISGLIEPVDCSFPTVIFNPHTFTTKEFRCKENNLVFSYLYILDDKILERVFQYTEYQENSSTLFFEIQNNLRSINQVYYSKSGISKYKFENNYFGSSKNKISEIFLIPQNTNYIFLTSKGEYCVLDKNFDRTDYHSFFQKVSNFISFHSEKFKNFDFNTGILSIIIAIFLYPTLFLLLMLLFIIIKIFFTKKKSYYSRRRSTSKKFSSFLLVASVSYIIAFGVFVKTFYNYLLSFLG